MTVLGEVRRILQVHTRYRQAGGEEAVVQAERKLLADAGFEVSQVVFENARIADGRSVVDDVRLAGSAVWSRAARARVADALASTHAQIMHVHNTFVAASPAIYSAAAERGVPVVQTLHNYRLVCPAATVFRDGHPCTDCVGRRVAWPGVIHACVRNSHTQSAVAAMSGALHWARGTYRREVTRYVALTEFQRRLMTHGKLPAAKIGVVPNFLEPDPGPGPEERRGFVFVGRLSVEKGIGPLLQAAELNPGAVSVVGTGPMADACAAADRRGFLRYLGPLPQDEVLARIRTAMAVVIPSLWFEGLPMVVLEAFATGTPVIASRLGSLIEIVADGVTGLAVPPNQPGALSDCIRWSVLHPQEMREMGAAARSVYEANYRGSVHLRLLRREYELAVAGYPTARDN